MTIAVTGATGRLGRLVVRALERLGADKVVAVARTPERAGDLGVEVRQGDYDDPESLLSAFSGVDRLLLISGTADGARIAQHTNAIQAAERANVQFVAYTSLMFDAPTAQSPFGEHRVTEALIDESPIPHTVLRNGWYWENYLIGLDQIVASGVLYGAAGAGRVAGAARIDYAEAAAHVLLTSGHDDRTYQLGSDERVTHAELAELITQVSGRSVRYENLSAPAYLELLEQQMPTESAEAIAAVEHGVAGGLLDVTTGDLAKLIGRPPTRLADVLRYAAP